MQYFEDSVPPAGDGLCSDNACPCPETRIPRGSGYLYISQELVDFRRKYPRLSDARQAKERELDARRAALGMQFTAIYSVGPIFVCEQGARLRNLDLETAAADARHWWATGQVPLRATPLAGASRQQQQQASESLVIQSNKRRSTAKKPWWKFW